VTQTHRRLARCAGISAPEAVARPASQSRSCGSAQLPDGHMCLRPRASEGTFMEAGLRVGEPSSGHGSRLRPDSGQCGRESGHHLSGRHRRLALSVIRTCSALIREPRRHRTKGEELTGRHARGERLPRAADKPTPVNVRQKRDSGRHKWTTSKLHIPDQIPSTAG